MAVNKWEYNTIHRPDYAQGNEDSLDEMLNCFGKDGWELVCIYKHEWFVFKRLYNGED